MSEFARRRRVARLAVSGLGFGLLALLWWEDQQIQIGLTVFVIGCLLAQRLSWRCPRCGLPISALPWGHPPACRRCGAEQA